MDFYIDKVLGKTVASQLYPVVTKMTIYISEKRVEAEMAYYEYADWEKQSDPNDPLDSIDQVRDPSFPMSITVTVDAIDIPTIEAAIQNEIAIKMKELSFGITDTDLVTIQPK